jgi:hypothetical protein
MKWPLRDCNCTPCARMVAGWPNPTPMEAPPPSHGLQRTRFFCASAIGRLPATVCSLLALALACYMGGPDAQIIDAADCKHPVRFRAVAAHPGSQGGPQSCDSSCCMQVNASRWAKLKQRVPIHVRCVASCRSPVWLHTSQGMRVG